MQRTEGKTIRAHRIRQTAIANSTSPVRDNYRKATLDVYVL